MDNFSLAKTKSGKWITPGISWGYGVRSNVEVIEKNWVGEPKKGDKAILKIKGATEWSGIGMKPEYWPTQYILVEFISFERVKVLEKSEPGKKWKKALAELKVKL